MENKAHRLRRNILLDQNRVLKEKQCEWYINHYILHYNNKKNSPYAVSIL